MQRPIEKLARLLDDEHDGSATMGQLAEKYGETVTRIMDAFEVLKILRHFGDIGNDPISYISI